MEDFEVGMSDTPVFRDGLTTSLSYAFLACKKADTYNGVVYDVQTHKLKFYPDAQFWGITQGILNDLEMGTLYKRSDYQGLYSVPPAKVVKVLERLRTQRGVTAVTDDAFESLGKFSGLSERQGSRNLHRARSGVPPRASLPSA